MRRAISTAILVAVTSLASGSVDAKQKTIAGDWTLSFENIGLRLVLTQKGRAVTGTLDYPHGSAFRLTGAFAAGTLTFSGDSAGQNFTVHIDATGSLNADDSLAGTLNAHFVELDDAHQIVRTKDQQMMMWTAVRRMPK